jgi:hypothetical protein
MSFLHRGKPRASPDLVAKAVKILDGLLDGTSQTTDKQLDDLSKSLATLKGIVFAAGDSEAARDAAFTIAREVYVVCHQIPCPALLYADRRTNALAEQTS